MMDGQGKSDGPIVPTKSPNKAGRAAAEAMEGRGSASRNRAKTTQPGHSAGYLRKVDWPVCVKPANASFDARTARKSLVR